MGYKIEDWERHWSEDNTPWVGETVNSDLLRLYPTLLTSFGLRSHSRALIPLSGDSSAVHFLYEQGHDVTAVEFVPSALERLRQRDFSKLSFVRGDAREDSTRVHLVAGDFFNYDDPPVSLIYDRAALVAIHPRERERYATHIIKHLLPGGLLFIKVTEMLGAHPPGPPYSVSADETRKLYPNLTECFYESIRAKPTQERYLAAGVEEFVHSVFVFRR